MHCDPLNNVEVFEVLKCFHRKIGLSLVLFRWRFLQLGVHTAHLKADKC